MRRPPRAAHEQGDDLYDDPDHDRARRVLARSPGLGAGRASAELSYNWSDYIAEDTIANFEAETGIKVNYDVYDNNEIVDAKLLARLVGL